MMAIKPVAPRLLPLQAFFGLVALGGVALLVLTLDRHRGPSVLGWAALVVTGWAGIAASLTVRFWRIRPIKPPSSRDYRSTVLLRMAVGSAPLLVGAAFAVTTGFFPGAVVGAAFSVYGLASAVPTRSDLARHEALWDELGGMPVAEVWGSADPDAIPPWEDPDGGHGHELFHSH